MGLFSGTKKLSYRIGINHPTMEYAPFVDTFRDYAESEDFAKWLKDKGLSVKSSELAYHQYVEGRDPSDFPYHLQLTLEPSGVIDFVIAMRGEKQGLALVFFSLTLTAELPASDKSWFVDFCKAIHQHYETVFAATKQGKGPLFDFGKYTY
ncbi:MAG: hypothetical protein LBN12_02805 [Clostridiales Family XIII bacterium]|jgi:hypothetical protein|nr:hypothetical protein [Clostridiales Family XIII bacterium]